MKCPKCGKDVIFQETKAHSGIVVCPKCYTKMTEKEARND
jgi:predicted RNA-binding Zn-ribbon protein involved in translation (DUF1610 family)